MPRHVVQDVRLRVCGCSHLMLVTEPLRNRNIKAATMPVGHEEDNAALALVNGGGYLVQHSSLAMLLEFPLRQARQRRPAPGWTVHEPEVVHEATHMEHVADAIGFLASMKPEEVCLHSDETARVARDGIDW